jgi:hypothetical protein
MNFKEIYKDIGEVNVGIRYTIIYEALHKLDIETITTTCGCTKAGYSPDTNEVTLIYKPKPIPKHLSHKNEYVVIKPVTIYYKDGRSETLTFKATVKR